ncbi:uncharacterized protein LOC110381481 isoform X1 [Helicoverpa armigera]|uniref:uncharacterized protein LOC110381481 isoform X1 n=1 Tax=Helicoverpa armigera TaxID=29058 RepID=UPI003083D635
MDHHPALIIIKYTYYYACDSIYGIDTFLHIVHRQVSDKAMRREHLQKSAILLLCDILSLIPFFRLVTTDPCPIPQMWPNILKFNEFLVIYRITDYFSLKSTHSYPMLLLGYSIVMLITVNCVSCLWLLATHEGFCEFCNNPYDDVYYDWRAFIWHKLNETDEGYATFVYGAVFVFSFAMNAGSDDMRPAAIAEFVIICVFLLVCYILTNFIFVPHALAESMLRFRGLNRKYLRVKKVIEETKRRNPNDNSHEQVELYYRILWEKQSCITTTPEFIFSLPRDLRVELRQDLLWALFYHSPTLRKTSLPFRRWVTEATVISFKLPGARFFSNKNANSSLIYLKSGIIQLLSIDDGVTPIISVTSGTVFGDVSFFVPHLKRKILARCVTYCEFYYIPRKKFLTALHKYPLDRRIILRDAKARLSHAKVLFANKQIVRGLDRNEDEGILWIKKRWWELHTFIENFTRATGEPREALKGFLPRDESIYHCSKYIGQLVLCNKTELQISSMFTNSKFPWIMNPRSHFGLIWYRIVSCTVCLVLFIHPQCLVSPKIPTWFHFFSFWTDTIYAIDIGVSLVTAVKKNDNITSTFATVVFERFKSLTFMLDLLSTIWFEDIFDLCGAPPQYYYTLQFNRLIKVYVLFHGEYLKFDIRRDPAIDVFKQIVLIYSAFFFISSHLVFELMNYFPDLTMIFYYGEVLCSKKLQVNCTAMAPIAGVAISWSFEWIYSENSPSTLLDSYVMVIMYFIGFVVRIYCKGKYTSHLFLTHKDVTKYQNFVIHLKSYYQRYRIHQDLLKRLDRYLICHWKYYRGTDVLKPNTLEDEARDIYWKAQGNVAKAVIGGSPVFKNADTSFITDLARAAKFLVLPKKSNILRFGIQSKNVSFVGQGYVQSEYANEKGEMNTDYYGKGSVLSIVEIFLGRVSLRSYAAATDVEIIYIPINKLWDIYKKYPAEKSYMENCINEYGGMYNDIFRKHVMKHRDYQTKLRDRLYSTRMSMISNSKMIADIQDTRSLPVEGQFWGRPESGFMQTWMLFRVIIVCISITSASMLGGVGAVSRWIFMMISAFCDCIAFIDIVIKLCLPYYDSRGLYITDKKMCLTNYLTKGFLLDITGAVPWFSVLKALIYQEISDDASFLINTVCKFAHLYILFAYFDYITDIPTVNLTYIMIIKWQIVNVLLVMGISHYLMINCVEFEFNKAKTLTGVKYNNETCWMPPFFDLPDRLNGDQLHLIFAQSLNLAECGMMRMNFGRFIIDRSHLGVGFILFVVGVLFWFISCYTLILLVLNGRGDTLFQHSVLQLQRFLKSERVEPAVIHKGMEHFTYCWLRTKGINIHQLTNDRIGVVFRQDLSYYFYKKTFTIFDSMFGGGESIQRQLASVSDVAYFLPGHDIFREMDIVPNVCIVHRGRVNIFKDGRKVIILTKGDIFGQLQGVTLRPIKVTATAEDNVDLLYIEVAAFQSIITDEMKSIIRKSKQSKNCFMATKNIYVENPYDTVQYLLRGIKTIKLPWSEFPTEACEGSWYTWWLFVTWLVNPFVSSVLVLLFILLPNDSDLWLKLYCPIFVMDAIDLVNFCAEFFTVELIVIRNRCNPHRLGLKKFKDWGLYVDALSLLIPLVTLFTHDWEYQTARLLRLKFFIDFEFHFCRGFRSQKAPYVLKLAIMILLLHIFTCGWIFFACRDSTFPIPLPSDIRNLNKTVDFSQWVHPDDRLGGCARSTRNAITDEHGRIMPSFVVPKYWPHDYVVAMTYILLIHTHTSIDTVIALSLKQVYYKVFVTFFMYLLDIWIMAVAINFAFNRIRVLYAYDSNVQTMLTYFINNGICVSLAEMVKKYADQVWTRQKGDWLPELVYQAPLCLRQDLFTALYIHHLEAPPTYRRLPDYFKRQLCARFSRVVIFPGKCIVREGDTFNTTYFIHEGEVEKWYTDNAGEGQLMSVLYTNGYFGCISGLFRNAGFQFSYYTRTVVDLVYLELSNWEDLLESYPDVKMMLYGVTKELRKESAKNAHGKPRASETYSGSGSG